MKNNMMKKLLTLVLAGAMTLSLAACGAKDTPSADQPDNSTEEAKTYKVAVIKQLDHASLDEIANAVTAELDKIAADNGVTIEYEVTSGQGDQTILKQLSDQAIADGVNAIIPIATTAAQIAALSAEETKTPVVYAAISDPETAKLTRTRTLLRSACSTPSMSRTPQSPSRTPRLISTPRASPASSRPPTPTMRSSPQPPRSSPPVWTPCSPRPTTSSWQRKWRSPRTLPSTASRTTPARTPSSATAPTPPAA